LSVDVSIVDFFRYSGFVQSSCLPDAGNTLQQGSHAAAMWPVVTVTVATSSLLCAAFTFFYKTYQPSQYIPDCVNFPFSALTLLVGWQEGHPACNKTEWWGADVCVRVIVLLPSVL